MHPTEEFLRLLWPAAGNKTIVGIKNGIVKHYWFTPDQFAEAAAKAAELAGSRTDAYYGLAGYSGNERKGEQAIAVRALWLDVDQGADKPYKSLREAAAALKLFLDATGLPVPVLVNSGYGLHAYYPFTTDIPVDEWRAMARKLKALCIQHKFAIDDKCTADIARILRPIGTVNYKNGTQRDVKMVNKTPVTPDEAVVRAVLNVTPQDMFEAMAAAMPKGAEVREGFASTGPTADFEQILSKCATLRWADENQGAVPEPLWYDVLGVAGFCVDGPTAVHRVSSRHPAYDRAGTTRKMEQRVAAAGPTTCERFRTHGGSRCTGCTHSVTSPIVLGHPRNVIKPPGDLPNLLASAPHFTHPDIRTIEGQFQVKVPVGKPDADGNQPWDWVMIAAHGIRPLLEMKLLDAAGVPANYVWMQTYDHTGAALTHFVISSGSITNNMQFGADCSKQGYYLEYETATAAYRRFHKIMREWVKQMKAAQGAIVTFQSFGWVGPDAVGARKDSFLLGHTLYSKDGEHVVPTIPALAPYQQEYRSQGSLDAWVAANDNYNRPGMEEYMFPTWIAWGAPLMKFTRNGSILYHINGESGHGKTSLQRAIVSVYGEYDGRQIFDSSESTLNSVGKTMGLLNSLPYLREEVTETDPEVLARWALSVSQGREKGRMNQNMGIAVASTWTTIGCLSGNLSLREIVASTRADSAARLARIFEQELHLPLDQQTAAALFAPLRSNFGVAGPVFIRYIVKNHDKVKRRVERMEEKLMVDLNGKGVDRFIIGMLAAMFVGAQIAFELGLIHHDLRRGMAFAIDQFNRLRVSADEERQTCEQNLGRFIQEMQPNTLVVEYDAPAGVTAVFDSDNNVVRGVSLNNHLTMRYAAKDGRFYASVAIMRKWYSLNHINFEIDLKALEAAGILTDRSKRMVLTKGTKMSDGKQAWCMVFDLTKSPLLREAAV